MTRFARYVGIDYSGADEPTSRRPNLRVFTATPTLAPTQVRPARDGHWSRADLASWLTAELRAGPPTIVGIDHAFSFPLRYFEDRLLPTWDAMLDDFATRCPTDIRTVEASRLPYPTGYRTALRLCEQWTGGAKSVFLFNVQGSVAHSTHAGLPWLRALRRELPGVHLWPFDGWTIPPGRSVVAEVYPSLFRRRYTSVGAESVDEHDARSIATWLRERDDAGFLDSYFEPQLTPAERETARLEGWILGVL